MMKNLLHTGLALMMLAFGSLTVSAEDFSSGEIPPELGRWRSWVLHGHEEKLCPPAFNDGGVVRCQWPSRLELDVTEDGGDFEQHWMIFADGWVALPGGPEAWPDGVAVDGQPAPVVNRGDVPSVWLELGEHTMTGRFYWKRMPEVLPVPPAVGLLGLTVAGRRIDPPVIDTGGRLWLRQNDSRGVSETRLQVRVFRLIDDTIPMTVTTLLRMDVSGPAREMRLDGVLLRNAVPMALESALPARLDADGQLVVQARPGRWEARVIARMPQAVSKLGVDTAPYGEEVWSFKPQHHLRMVEIAGAPQVEPGQTEMPDGWRGFSAYLLKSGGTLQFRQLRRGNPDPAPDQLSLFRRLWLDFDGAGFTVQDTMDGTLSRQWRLAVNPPMVLGRVAVAGRDQVITALGEEQKAGVELRQGALRLRSEARMPRRGGPFNAVGWDHDFQNLRAELYLPPGWRLLAAAGVDQASDTWLANWSLLDFFLVLIITLAVAKLKNRRWAVLTLATLALIYHEPGAPRLVWLHILAVLALLALLPGGWFRRLVSLWGGAAFIALLLISIPFIMHQVRWGLYPQLAPHNDFQYNKGAGAPDLAATMGAAEPEAARQILGKSLLRSMKQAPLKPEIQADAAQGSPEKALWHQDPDALIPTGPGLPEWHWQTIRLTWNGPVSKAQTTRLFLLPPVAGFVLALARVALLALMIWGIMDWKPWWKKIQPHLKSGAVSTAALVIVCLVVVQDEPAMAADTPFPPAEMLEALRGRLLEPSECLPYCADVSRLEMTVAGDELRLILKVNGAGLSAIPLPVNRESWQPGRILMDNAPLAGLARDNAGMLWAVIPRGLHTVMLEGDIAGQGVVRIPLPLKPHIASYTAEGWTVKGILPDGTAGSSIQLTRLAEIDAGGRIAMEKSALPAFLKVQRVLHLGLTWQATTIIERMTPTGSPVVVGIPLLAGEAVTSAGLQVDQGQVLINMPADQQRLSYRTTLQTTDRIQLTAPRAVPWTETWRLDASPIWHCELEGIAPIHLQQDGGQWQPQWHPWPGESVVIQVSRPKAMDGQSLTLQRTELVMTPGQRFRQGELVLGVNTSRGAQHTLDLPPKAILKGVRVDQRSLPVRQDGQSVTVPLQPGHQTVTVQWDEPEPFSWFFKTPPVGIGHGAVNARVSVNMPQKRWILMAGGPYWGPAILFWSYLAVIVLIALVLGRLTVVPLKTRHWILLGLGLTQVPVPMALLIVGWLLVMGWRDQRAMPNHWLGFNMLQIGIVFLTLAAMVCLFMAVKAGLAGQPEMQIAGNDSTFRTLNWTQDRIGRNMPRPWVFSLPLWSYRVFMLAWSLWLACALLSWLRWAWRCFTKNGAWKKAPPRKMSK